MKEKEVAKTTDPLGKEKEYPVGDFVTLRQTNYPIKMFVLQEFGESEEIRIGYYIVSLKKLSDEGKLQLFWGQFNPSLPKDDFRKLIERAKEKGIL